MLFEAEAGIDLATGAIPTAGRIPVSSGSESEL